MSIWVVFLNQHQILLCVSIVERTIPYVLNLTQDSHIVLFVPKTAECEKNPDHEGVLSVLGLLARLVLVNDDCEVECPYSFYNKWGVEGMGPKEFRAYFGEYVEENLNDADAKENLDDDDDDNENDNYDQ